MKKINIKLDTIHVKGTYLGGWLDGKRTYVGVYDEHLCYGTLAGRQLLRLTRQILKELEEIK